MSDHIHNISQVNDYWECSYCKEKFVGPWAFNFSARGHSVIDRIAALKADVARLTAENVHLAAANKELNDSRDFHASEAERLRQTRWRKMEAVCEAARICVTSVVRRGVVEGWAALERAVTDLEETRTPSGGAG